MKKAEEQEERSMFSYVLERKELMFVVLSAHLSLFLVPDELSAKDVSVFSDPLER